MLSVADGGSTASALRIAGTFGVETFVMPSAAKSDTVGAAPVPS